MVRCAYLSCCLLAPYVRRLFNSHRHSMTHQHHVPWPLRTALQSYSRSASHGTTLSQLLVHEFVSETEWPGGAEGGSDRNRIEKLARRVGQESIASTAHALPALLDLARSRATRNAPWNSIAVASMYRWWISTPVLAFYSDFLQSPMPCSAGA